VTPADFEITAWLTARELRTHIPPDAQLETMSGGGTFIRGEAQSRAREAVERTGCSRDVIVEKRVVAAVGVGVIGDDVQKQLSRGQ
jgi:hypothetical protein